MSVKSVIQNSDLWFAGEDKEIEFTIRDENGDTINVTGWTLAWDLFVNDVSVVSKTDGAGITLTDPANGVVLVTIDAADTVAIAEGNHFHQLKRTNAGDVQILAHGKAFLNEPPA